MGMLLGDGGMTHCSPSFTTADAELAEAVRQGLEPLGVRPRLRGMSGRAECYDLVAGTRGGRSKNPLTEELRRLGLWGKKSPAKFVPAQYKLASAATRLAVLQGLMDTDGTSAPGNRAGFASTSEVLRDDVVWLARSLGLQATCIKAGESPPGPKARLSSAENTCGIA